jgi:hypothetical protein
VVKHLLSMADGDREAELREALFDAVAIRETNGASTVNGTTGIDAPHAMGMAVRIPPKNGRNGSSPSHPASTDESQQAESDRSDPDELAHDDPHAIARR